MFESEQITRLLSNLMYFAPTSLHKYLCAHWQGNIQLEAWLQGNRQSEGKTNGDDHQHVTNADLTP